MVVGTAGKNAELKHVGSKNTALTSFSLALGKDKEGNTKWAECAAWQRLSGYAAGIKKGDIVLAIGTIKSNVSQTNGKTYNTLECEFVCNPATQGFDELAANASHAASSDNPKPDADKVNTDFTEITGDDLPF